jgi:hypothetical protein
MVYDSTVFPYLTSEELLIDSRGTYKNAVRRMQVRIKKTIPGISDIPGPLYIEAQAPQFSGNKFSVQGADHVQGDKDPNNYITGGDHRPAVSATIDSANLAASIGSHTDQVTSRDPSGGLVQNSINPGISKVNLVSMAHFFVGDNGELADTRISSPSQLSNLGGSYPNNYEVTYIDNDITIAGKITGAGVLVVNGDLHISGQLEFTGLVIVLGKVHLDFEGDTTADSTGNTSVTGGGQGTHIRGSLMSKRMTLRFQVRLILSGVRMLFRSFLSLTSRASDLRHTHGVSINYAH